MAADGVLPVDMHHKHGALPYFAEKLTYLTEELLGRLTMQDGRGDGATVPMMERQSVLAGDVVDGVDGAEELGTSRRALYLEAGLLSFADP
jgi:hypothetical protein